MNKKLIFVLVTLVLVVILPYVGVNPQTITTIIARNSLLSLAVRGELLAREGAPERSTIHLSTSKEEES